MSLNANSAGFVPGRFNMSQIQDEMLQQQLQRQHEELQRQQEEAAQAQEQVVDSWEQDEATHQQEEEIQQVEEEKQQVEEEKQQEKQKSEEVEKQQQHEETEEYEEKHHDEGSEDDDGKETKKEKAKREHAEREAQLEAMDDAREHLNIVFIGHVDAGKSTISGNILLLTGEVDERTIEKYTREAKEKNRSSWFLAFIIDTNEEERAKGKTVEVGRAHFSTDKKRYTILDAPGHERYVPNMIAGVAQADVGVLVISARKGEFEAGFDRNGQTREHAILAKTLGVKKLIVVVNKMDESTVQWSEARFDEIQKKLGRFLRGKLGYGKNDVEWIPISGWSGSNLVKPDRENCPWYKGPSLIELLDSISPFERAVEGKLRAPVIDTFKSEGKTHVLAKIESGILKSGSKICFSPNNVQVQVLSIKNHKDTLAVARPGENVEIIIKISQVEEDSIHAGSVISGPDDPIAPTSEFVGQVAILELPEEKVIFSAGYECVLHTNATQEEVTVVRMLQKLNPKTGDVIQKLPTHFIAGQVGVVHFKLNKSLCLETFEESPCLGRFTLRDQGKTIAYGKILATHAPQRGRKPPPKK